MKKVNQIFKVIYKFLITALEPFFLSIIDIMKYGGNIEINIIKNAVEIESEFIKDIISTIKDSSIIDDASKLYYTILIVMDIFLISSIFKGKIVYIQMEDLITYIICFIAIVFSVLNLLLKHSKFNNKIKLFSVIQVLVIIPIVFAYWIVSIEGNTFEFKNLDVNQWSSIFNNVIIYFATCIIGIVSTYKSFFDSNNN